MKIAVIADTHLPDCADSAQEASLRWALSAAAAAGADLVALAGDLTAAGEDGAAARLFDALSTSAVPGVITPGNADLRTPATAADLRQRLSEPAGAAAGGVHVVGLDSADGAIGSAERARFQERLRQAGAAPVAVVTHWPPTEWPADDRDWLAGVLRATGVEVIIVGHKHLDAEREIAGITVHLVRGLDPDKAKAAPPALSLFSREEGTWHRQDVAFPHADPRTWPAERRHEWLGLLGLSAMDRTLADTGLAAGLAAPCLELRADAAALADPAALRQAVQHWRAAGGRCLSMHLTNLRWDAATEAVTGLPAWREGVRLAIDLGVDQVTVHPPRGALADLHPDGRPRDRCLQACAEALPPLLDAGVTVGVENLHLARGEADDERRTFGCLPDECLGWIEALRQRLGSTGLQIGMHLDIGHARNNGPLASRWTLGRWYASVGDQVVGYHLHQVTAAGNHQPIDNPFGPFLSLASFFWAWQAGQLRPAPMFLEIRPDAAADSLKALRAYLTNGDDPRQETTKPCRTDA